MPSARASVGPRDKKATDRANGSTGAAQTNGVHSGAKAVEGSASLLDRAREVEQRRSEDDDARWKAILASLPVVLAPSSASTDAEPEPFTSSALPYLTALLSSLALPPPSIPSIPSNSTSTLPPLPSPYLHLTTALHLLDTHLLSLSDQLTSLIELSSSTSTLVTDLTEELSAVRSLIARLKAAPTSSSAQPESEEETPEERQQREEDTRARMVTLEKKRDEYTKRRRKVEGLHEILLRSDPADAKSGKMAESADKMVADLLSATERLRELQHTKKALKGRLEVYAQMPSAPEEARTRLRDKKMELLQLRLKRDEMLKNVGVDAI